MRSPRAKSHRSSNRHESYVRLREERDRTRLTRVEPSPALGEHAVSIEGVKVSNLPGRKSCRHTDSSRRSILAAPTRSLRVEADRIHTTASASNECVISTRAVGTSQTISAIAVAKARVIDIHATRIECDAPWNVQRSGRNRSHIVAIRIRLDQNVLEERRGEDVPAIIESAPPAVRSNLDA